MKTQEALEILGLLASEQRGLVTTRQAEENGVSRLYLQRLEADGVLTRNRTGVYALPSSVPGNVLDTYAAWLFLTATQAAGKSEGRVVASGQTAALLHGIGQFAPDRYEFTVEKLRKTRQPDLKFKVGFLADEDITYIDSMPVLTVAATLEQLDRDGVDGDHLARASEDAIASKMSAADVLVALSRVVRANEAALRPATLPTSVLAALPKAGEPYTKMRNEFANAWVGALKPQVEVMGKIVDSIMRDQVSRYEAASEPIIVAHQVANEFPDAKALANMQDMRDMLDAMLSRYSDRAKQMSFLPSQESATEKM